MRNDKSPLNPHAIGVDGLTPDHHIIRFNTKLGILGEYTVLESPRVYDDMDDDNDPHAVRVKLRDMKTEKVEYHFLTDMGIIPIREGVWHTTNFAVGHQDRNSLPETSSQDETLGPLQLASWEDEGGHIPVARPGPMPRVHRWRTESSEN